MVGTLTWRNSHPQAVPSDTHAEHLQILLHVEHGKAVILDLFRVCHGEHAVHDPTFIRFVAVGVAQYGGDGGGPTAEIRMLALDIGIPALQNALHRFVEIPSAGRCSPNGRVADQAAGQNSNSNSQRIDASMSWKKGRRGPIQWITWQILRPARLFACRLLEPRRHVHPNVAHGTVEGAAIDGGTVEGFAAGVGVDHGDVASGITAQLDVTLFFELELAVVLP